jgi:acyl-CoA reductase-like NAD-dependent aldehyde dehydrogenase
MNESDLDLTASIWTRDVATGENLMQQIKAGTTFVSRVDFPSPVSISTNNPIFPTHPHSTEF